MFGRKKKNNNPDREKKDKNSSAVCEKKGVCNNLDCCENCDNSCQVLDDCKRELEQVKEKLVRVTADLQNFKKRVEKEKFQWMFIAQSELISNLLSIVDDFDRALAEKKKEDISPELVAFLDGFAMISKSLYKFLEKYNVMEITETKRFDPNIHEAISQIDSPDHKAGDIVDVIQKGFMLKDKLLRPAKVVVAK